MHHTTLILLGAASLSYLTLNEILTRKFNNSLNTSQTKTTSILGASLSEYLNHKEHVHIVGGGISGLLMGFVCKELNIPFTIYEANDECGGLLGSERISFDNGNGKEEWMIAEKAANGVMWTPQVELLCERIGLEALSTKKEAKARFFVRNAKLTQFPVSYWSVFNLLTWRMWKLPLTSSFETLDDYFGFYFGEKIKKQFLEPAFAGIFGTGLDNLSVFGTTEIFPKLLSHSLSFPIALVKNIISEIWSGIFGSRKEMKSSNRRGTHSFPFGVQDLIDHLVRYIGNNIKYGFKITDLSQFPSDQRVILTTPAYQTANIIRGNLSDTQRGNELIELFSKIRYTPIATCTVIVERSKCPKLEKGFGCLIPRNEGIHILGVLFNSSIFLNRVSDDEKFASLTCIMQDDETIEKLSDEELLENIVRKELSLLFMSSEKENISIVKSSMKRWKCGIPVYNHHLYKSWESIHSIMQQDLPNVNLFGNYTGQISIRGMIGQAVDLLTSLQNRKSN